MLTLKHSAYTPEELLELQNALATAHFALGKTVCNEGMDCKKCPYRHACDDLSNVISYIRKIYKTRKACDSQES